MLCSYGFQSAFNPFHDFDWYGLWLEVHPVLHQRDLLHTASADLDHSLELMDRLQNKVLEETGHFQRSEAPKPVSYQLHTDEQPFVLSLDAPGFSPEELSVRLVDRTLRIQGRTEKKQDDQENGCYSYKVQEWTQELPLPEEVNTEALHCYLSPNGTLHIQEGPNPSAERELPITKSLEEDRLTQDSSGTEGHHTQNSGAKGHHTQDSSGSEAHYTSGTEGQQ